MSMTSGNDRINKSLREVDGLSRSVISFGVIPADFRADSPAPSCNIRLGWVLTPVEATNG